MFLEAGRIDKIREENIIAIAVLPDDNINYKLRVKTRLNYYASVLI